jgi:hypothetical protein
MKGSCCEVFFDREVKSSFIPYILGKWREKEGKLLGML